MESQEIKKEIKRLKRLKLQCRSGSKERIILHRQIKELKNKLIDLNKPEPEKDKLIAEILRKDILLSKIEIDLKKFSIAELQKHLDLITKKTGI